MFIDAFKSVAKPKRVKRKADTPEPESETEVSMSSAVEMYKKKFPKLDIEKGDCSLSY